MKTKKLSFLLVFSVFILSFFSINSTSVVTETESTNALPNFEIVVPWTVASGRGEVIKSMIDNSTLAGKYNFTYSIVGGDPSARDTLVSRFLAGDYPNLLIITQDWYTEFSSYGIWHDFSPQITNWTTWTTAQGWRTDIPEGWWSILDKANGDGTGSNIYALPFFGQSILPYVNTKNLTTAGLTLSDVNDTLAKFMDASKTLHDNGITAFAEVGQLSSDLAYMNYMMGSTNNFINNSADPATVFSWDANNNYGVNGSLSVQGFADWLKMKGEGYAQSTVDTDGGGDANNIFGRGDAAMIFCGPWGSSIFMTAGLNASDFTVIPMPKTADGVRSTITGGGMTMIPKASLQPSQAYEDDAVILSEWLLQDVNQMKIVDNWQNNSWRIPVRTSLVNNPWFTEAGHPERQNLVTHIQSQSYAFPWGRQYPKWLDVHTAVMMPGYKAALDQVKYGQGYTDAEYLSISQKALDKMAADIQCYYLGGPCVVIAPSVITTVVSGSTIVSTVSTTSTKSTPGFEIFIAIPLILGVAGIHSFRRRRK